MSDMKLRRAATQKTVDRYRGKAFDWGRGVTCAHLLRAHLRNMGHKPPTVPRFRSALAAKRALTDRGHDGMAELLDSLVTRLPAPAYAVLGDVALCEGDDGLGLDAVFICAGPRRFFGWREDYPEPVMLEIDLDQVKAVWRV